MSESREELEAMARRLCEAAGWIPYGAGVSSLGDLRWQLEPNGYVKTLNIECWLPIARVVKENDRLRHSLRTIWSVCNQPGDSTPKDCVNLILHYAEKELGNHP